MLLLAACSSAPPPPPATSHHTATTTTAAAPPAASTTAEPAAAAACRADADCHVVSEYCGGCHCWAGPTATTPPACDQAPVMCFVDPCRGVRAACQAGQCVALR